MVALHTKQVSSIKSHVFQIMHIPSCWHTRKIYQLSMRWRLNKHYGTEELTWLQSGCGMIWNPAVPSHNPGNFVSSLRSSCLWLLRENAADRIDQSRDRKWSFGDSSHHNLLCWGLFPVLEWSLHGQAACKCASSAEIQICLQMEQTISSDAYKLKQWGLWGNIQYYAE